VSAWYAAAGSVSLLSLSLAGTIALLSEHVKLLLQATCGSALMVA
jgi:hypothetical protein